MKPDRMPSMNRSNDYKQTMKLQVGQNDHRPDKEDFLRTIRELLEKSKLLQSFKVRFDAGETLLRENQQNDKLYIILDGMVEQVKESAGRITPIDMHGPGAFMGLLSFQTGEPAFTSVMAKTDLTALVVNHEDFDRFLTKYPSISRLIQGLAFSNLSDRYRRVVTLHVQVDLLSKQLEQERNQLQRAISELERTRDMLITQEKMATLGELTAGLAHEINNPASALLRSVDYLIRGLPDLIGKSATLPDTGLLRTFFESGMMRDIADTSTSRERMKGLGKDFPELSRTDLRRLTEMPDEMLGMIGPLLKNPKRREEAAILLEAWQAGVFMNGIKISTSRIEYLVKSLKSYSRPSGKEPELADIRTGIRETLQILGNRLNEVDVKLNLPAIPKVKCFVGELNQVWTNLVINACDAMEDKGTLYVTCGTTDSGMVWTRFGDTGPGVPEMLKNRIFDSSFTTKTAGGEFGLGIGLAICKGIIEKHGGSIRVLDREGGGAEFEIKLPPAS